MDRETLDIGDIEQELEKKSIERDGGDEEVEVQISELEPEVIEEAPKTPVKKVKKARSEKQIAAFEKARLKRAEGIAARKKDKEEQKELKKELKKNPLPAKVVPSVSTVQEHGVSKPVVQPSPGVASSRADRPEVIQNHYYYYGVPPPQDNHYNQSKKKNKKSKRPPTPDPSSSESESSEEEEYVPSEPTIQLPPKYKFNYA